jgi:hypothetical protein
MDIVEAVTYEQTLLRISKSPKPRDGKLRSQHTTTLDNNTHKASD